MGDKNEICVVFLFEIPADEFFLLRLQIEGVTDFAVVFLCHQLFGLTEFYKGDLICFRKGDIQDLKLRGVVFFQKLHRVLEKTGLHLADFHEILDVAHLKIQAGVLVQMSSGVVLLSTENRTGLKDAIENAHHHLFVKLRALGQNGRFVEIAELEHVGSSLSSFGSDLRCMDLGKTVLMKKFTEASHDAFLDAESGPLPDVPKGNGADVQLGFQRSVQLPFINGKGKGFCWRGENRDLLRTDFFSVGRSLFCPDSSFYPDAVSLFQLRNGKICFSLFPDRLQKTVSFSQDHESDLTHVSNAIDTSVCQDLLVQRLRSKHLGKLQSFFFSDSCYKFHITFPPKIYLFKRETPAGSASIQPVFFYTVTSYAGLLPAFLTSL